MDWLWTFRGQLLVISTPYHHGVHYAKHPLHFTPIIKHLARLHSQGFVHGDIRAYNMVLQYDVSQTDQGANINSKRSKGWLVDFDLGGKRVDKVCYPNGYNDFLRDGTRPGSAGEEITILDDWKSFIDVILNKHSFYEKKGVELTNEQEGVITKKEKKLNSYFDKEFDLSPSPWEESARLLIDYLEHLGDDYDVEPKPFFKKNLEDCGFCKQLPSEEQRPLNVSPAATGSPPK